MSRPKHVDMMEKIQESAYGSGRRRLPQGKWAELVRAIAEDIENDDLDKDGKERVMMALGRAAVEMDQNEKETKMLRDEVGRLMDRPKREKVPREKGGAPKDEEPGS